MSHKSPTRASRTVLRGSTRRNLTRSNPQPAKSVALSATENKQQIISYLFEQLREKRRKIHEATIKQRPKKYVSKLINNGVMAVFMFATAILNISISPRVPEWPGADYE